MLEQVAADAGYTRGALYNLFASKEDLALAVIDWVEETWWAHMDPLIFDDSEPLATLVAVARAHAVLCRREIARVGMTLRIEFSGQDHPVGRAVDATGKGVVAAVTRLIAAGRDRGAIPPGPPPVVTALAFLGAVEGLVISVAGRDPFDEELAGRAAAGVLGVALDHDPPPAQTG